MNFLRAATLAIEDQPIAQLIPFSRNARTHSKHQIRQIADSIKAFGFPASEVEHIVASGLHQLLESRQRLLNILQDESTSANDVQSHPQRA
jgi:hypothetical protein